MSEEKKDEGGIIDFIAKIIFTIVLVYVASYFSGHHEMVMGFLKNIFHPAIKAAQNTTKAVDIELKRRGIHVSNKGVEYVDPKKDNSSDSTEKEAIPDDQ